MKLPNPKPKPWNRTTSPLCCPTLARIWICSQRFQFRLLLATEEERVKDLAFEALLFVEPDMSIGAIPVWLWKEGHHRGNSITARLSDNYGQ